MTYPAANLTAIILGLGVFLVIVAIGWRSVQKRRIVRMQGANGQETIILAREGDDVSSVIITTTETAVEPATMSLADDADRTVAPNHLSTPEFGRKGEVAI